MPGDWGGIPDSCRSSVPCVEQQPVHHELPGPARMVLAGEPETTLSGTTLQVATDGVAIVQLF